MTTSLKPGSKVRIGRDILCREIEGEAVVLNPKTGVYYGLDPVGTRIWHLMEQNKPLPGICKTLQDEFEVEEKRCQADVLKFAAHLLQSGLVTVAS